MDSDVRPLKLMPDGNGNQIQETKSNESDSPLRIADHNSDADVVQNRSSKSDVNDSVTDAGSVIIVDQPGVHCQHSRMFFEMRKNGVHTSFFTFVKSLSKTGTAVH